MGGLQKHDVLLPLGAFAIGAMPSLWLWHDLHASEDLFPALLVLAFSTALFVFLIVLTRRSAADRAALHAAEARATENGRIYADVFENSEIAITDADMSGLFAHLEELRRNGVKDLAQLLARQPEALQTICRLVRLNTMNPAGLKLFGGESVEQLRQIDYFLQSDRPAQVREFALALWNGADTVHRDARYVNFAKKEIAIIYSLRVPKTLEAARQVPIVSLDVTEMRSAESARQASLAKSQFLASMSHEIRTPLNGIIGNLELLAQTELKNHQEELLFDAEKAAKSLLALIGNILDFSKIEAGKLTIESVDLNPAAIVQEAVDIVQSRARQRGTFITSFIAPDVPELVRGDPTRIRQILLNLLGNSVKFTAQGGVHINLQVKDWDDSICQLLVTVHDSGRGFDPALTKELFRPFTQDYKRAADDLGGTGLGLSICKSLVDTFGGEIDCESVKGHGATFWFTIPVQVLKPAKTMPVPNLANRAVLFVNTEPDDLPPALAGYLRKRGATLLTAADDETALAMSRNALAKGEHIDLAIYVVKRDQWPTTSFGDALRESSTVPMVCASDASPVLWRKALRSGASYLLTDDVEADFFDRNIHQAFGGFVGEGERTAARNAAIAPDAALLIGKHVLVLEDRLVNQTIIQRQLKTFHMTCTIAGDGRAGLERLAAGKFDLILCGCSMPEMNGYEFTRAVREREMEKGGTSHIPIIAMTANAFREDREKCFAAGMDDFVSKPVTLHRLSSVLTEWLGKGRPPTATAKVPAPAPEPVVVKSPPRAEAVDIAMLQNLLGSDDPDLLIDIVGEFVAAARESWREVRVSAERRDPVELKKAAHGAKGEARNVGAVVLGDLYEALEHTARANDMRGVDELIKAIPAELQRVESFASQYAARAAQ